MRELWRDFHTEIVVMVVGALIVAGIIFAVVASDANFERNCRRHGGVPVTSAYNGNRCYPPGQMIDTTTPKGDR